MVARECASSLSASLLPSRDGPRTTGDREAARLVLGDGEGGLRWSFDSQDVRRGFFELPSSFSTDQLL
jgi:hypothetical protein